MAAISFKPDFVAEPVRQVPWNVRQPLPLGRDPSVLTLALILSNEIPNKPNPVGVVLCQEILDSACAS